MAKNIGNRIKETSTTTGTGALTLDGAVSGFLPFSALGGLPKTVDYAIEWAGGFEVGVGRIETGGTTLTRLYVLSKSPSTLRSMTTNQQVSLPGGEKIISLVVPDYNQIAVMSAADGSVGVSVDPPMADGNNAIAVGIQAQATANNTIAIGFAAQASKPYSQAFSGVSRGENSVTHGLNQGSVSEQIVSGIAVSGAPVAMLSWQLTDFNTYVVEITAIAADEENTTPLRVIKRRLVISGGAINYASSDDVLHNSFGTVPTLTQAIAGAPDGEGFYPLTFTGSSSGALPVWWRVFVKYLY